jgi:transcriptional regulator with XRE-family HTH domain
MTFGQKIRGLRKKKKLTQRQLAKVVQVDFTYLSKIENDQLPYTPSIKTIQALAQALNADGIELLNLANKVPESLSSVVSDKKALQFFRKASEIVKKPEEWDDFLSYLEKKKKKEKP